MPSAQKPDRRYLMRAIRPETNWKSKKILQIIYKATTVLKKAAVALTVSEPGSQDDENRAWSNIKVIRRLQSAEKNIQA